MDSFHCSGYPSSHSHGSAKNGYISNTSFLSFRVIFHWTMIVKRLKSPPTFPQPFRKCSCFRFPPKKKKPTSNGSHTPTSFFPPKKIWKPRPMPRKPRVSPASFSQLSPQPRPERKETSPWRMGFSGSLAHGEYSKSPRPGVVALPFCLFVGLYMGVLSTGYGMIFSSDQHQQAWLSKPDGKSHWSTSHAQLASITTLLGTNRHIPLPTKALEHDFSPGGIWTRALKRYPVSPYLPFQKQLIQKSTLKQHTQPAIGAFHQEVGEAPGAARFEKNGWARHPKRAMNNNKIFKKTPDGGKQCRISYLVSQILNLSRNFILKDNTCLSGPYFPSSCLYLLFRHRFQWCWRLVFPAHAPTKTSFEITSFTSPSTLTKKLAEKTQAYWVRCISHLEKKMISKFPAHHPPFGAR